MWTFFRKKETCIVEGIHLKLMERMPYAPLKLPGNDCCHQGSNEVIPINICYL